MKFIQQNLKPIAMVVLCTALGVISGHAVIGLCIGLALVAAATLFYE